MPRFRTLLFHTRVGGALITDLSVLTPAARTQLLAFLAELAERRDLAALKPPSLERDGRTNREKDLDTLAWSLEELDVAETHVLAINRADVLAKIAEDVADRYLHLVERPGDAVLDHIPAEVWESRCTLRTSSSARLDEWPSSYDAPPLALRKYVNVTCAPRQVVIRDNVVLPDTYNRIEATRLRSSVLVEAGPLSVLRPNLSSAARLPGHWFHLDNIMRGHFGHAMTEQLSHLWGWREAKRRYPDLKALVFSNRGDSLAHWEVELLAAAGIAPDDLHFESNPVEVEALVTATPAFSRPYFVHPAIQSVYEQVGANLARNAQRGDLPARIFLSRRSRKRSCNNAGAVEQLFLEHGFSVLYPEDHPLSDQAQLVRRAQVIAGFAGSNMFNIALAGDPKHVIVVGSENYPAINEYMLSSVLGHDLDVVQCRADVARENGRFSEATFHSDFTFDDSREGVFLRRVLADL